MVLVLLWFAIRKRPAAVIGGALALVLALPLVPTSYWNRLQSITDGSKDDTGSREARRTLLRESARAFLENPLTGVGAGQFKNWDPQGREQPWRESHDVFLQVAAELGIGGLALFAFLVARGGLSVMKTRKLLRRIRYAGSVRGKRMRSGPLPQVDGEEMEWVDTYSAAMAAALTGWLVCALFGSVAYNWTFYYLLALAAAPRDVLLDRVPAPRASRRHVPQPRFEAAQA
jgi:O-antigen ligase